MKKFFYLLVLMLIIKTTNAQETSIIVDGETKPAISRDVNEKESDVIDALKYYFQQKGVKKFKKSKGIYTVKGIKINEITNDNLDLFFSIDRKGKKKDKLTTVSMAVHTTERQFVGESTHEQIKQKLPAFMDLLPTIVSDYHKKLEADRLQKEADDARKEKEKLEKQAAKQAAKAAKLQKEADQAKTEK